MTPEEKQLLLKDLCARVPYGVKLNFYSAAIKENYTCTLLGIEPNDDKSIIAKADSGAFMFPSEHIKPYLRPISSMTEEEVTEYLSMCDKEDKDVLTTPRYSGVDWLLSHHFDFRGLIEKGLALEAIKDMYKEKLL